MPWWHRLIVLGAALLVTLIVARLVDRRMARRDLPAGAVTRYRILRRSVISGIIFVGVLSSLLVIPQVRAVAAVRGLRRDAAEAARAGVVVTALEDKARLPVSVWADDEPAAERLESELRLRAHARLREAGVIS